MFWRIFLSFWLAMTLIVVSSVLVSFYLAAERLEAAESFRPDEAFGEAAIRLRDGGVDGLKDWLGKNADIAPGLTLYVFDERRNDLIGRRPPRELLPRLRRLSSHLDRHRLPPNFRPSRRFPELIGPNGERFVLMIGRARPGPFGILDAGGTRLAVLVIALGLSALVCWLLARTLSRPVVELQKTARSLADGALETAVPARILARRDEFGDLGRDFDAMRRDLKRMLDAQRALLGNVSHELRSPLARIAVALELARRHAGDSAELDRIARECERLDTLIGQTLRLARLDAATQTPGSELVDLVALVDQVVADARFEAEAANRSVAWQNPGEVRIRGDTSLLASAVENVVRNALRYTPEGSTVEVDLRADASSGEAVIVVADAGPGVPADALSTIFEPFVRVDPARDRASGGDGLGLAITARAIRVHGGRVAARNRAGGGLAVEIRLPLA